MIDGRMTGKLGRLCATVLPVVVAAGLASPAARADPNCMANVLTDVPAQEAPEQVKSKRSGTFGPITHIKVSKRTGQMYYCAANSYCYGSNAFRIVTPCRFKLDKGSNTDEFFQYSAR